MAELKTFLSPYLTGDVFALVYLVAGILFILGLKGLAHPSSARRGNNFAMLGMFIAILVTLFHPQITDYMWIFVPMALGALVGVPIALKINMTAMPQLVAILHSFVGLAAVLVAAGMFLPFQPQLINPDGVVSEGVLPQLSTATMIEIFMGAWIGAITFTGSVVAFAKLNGNFRSAPITFKGQHLLNLAIFVAMIYFGVYFAMYQSVEAFVVMCALAFLLGFTLIIPIGGADMPVIVSMLNSYSGWAAAATGFTLNNMQLIIAGALIGSSGAILSYIMCKAMNRSFISVVLGGFGADDDPAASERASAVEKGVKAAAV